jgi:hyperosmotically inducible periplasmic protein
MPWENEIVVKEGVRWLNPILRRKKMKKQTKALSLELLVLSASLLIAPHALAKKSKAELQTQNDPAHAEQWLQKEVRHELLLLPYYSVFDNLSYRVDGDTVELSGQVTRPTLKSDAERAVKNIEGVSKVVNNIEVLPLSPNDDRIRLDVYRALYGQNSPLFRYSLGAVGSIHIIVKNGNVTLVGQVDSEMDKNIANIRANGVSGVFSVTNDLTVGKG